MSFLSQDADASVLLYTFERLAALMQIVPKSAIGVVLRKYGRGTAPCRRLPRWFLIAMALFSRDS